MEAHVVLARRLEQAEGAVHVGAHERLRVGDGVVVVGLGGEVHDGVHAGDDLLQQRSSQMSPWTKVMRSSGMPARLSRLPA